MSQKPQYNRRSIIKKSLLYGAGLLLGRIIGLPVFAQAKLLEDSAYLNLEMTLGQPAGGRIEKPYVAVWLEDEKGNHVKTISLWVNKAELERTRWVDDLRRWFKINETRKSNKQDNLVTTVSSPTRPAGKYNLTWNCHNESKETIAAGTYTLLIESAREHGQYKLIRETVTFGAEGFTKILKGDMNVQDVKLDYHPRK